MRFANMYYKWRNDEVNIGDDIQLLAIDYIYSLMGIEAKDIIRIPFYELTNYQGEDVILPISFPFHNYIRQDYFTVFSEKIHPVFLNLSLYGQYLSDKDIHYLKKYEPIGCRDLNTLRVLQKAGILAYASGCVTQILPKKDSTITGEKYFWLI